MKKISVPESMSAGIKKFAVDKSIDIEIQADGGDLTVEAAKHMLKIRRAR